MNKTEAMRVNTLLRWIMGDPQAPNAALEDARFAAAELAKRARAALGAGVGPGQIEDWFDQHQPRVLPGNRLAPEVAELLAGWWELEEGTDDPDDGGPINGGDLVTFIGEWLTTTCGANTVHPLRRAMKHDRAIPGEGHDEWDEVRDLRPFAAEHGTDQYVPPVCVSCGSPIRDPENAPVEQALCRDCAGAEALADAEEGARA